MTLPNGLESVAARICSRLNASLDRTLGAGAHKKAYLIAVDGTWRALKVAPVSEELRVRFERETSALKQCRHPAVASLLHSEAYREGDQEYWVTVEEFLAGGTLAETLARGAIENARIRAIGIAIAGALARLHELNFVHRDIKPSNILFRTPDEPVLTDFGIVRVLGEPSLTQDFMAQGPGTPLYAAPEQLLNEKALIDWRTDQFGLALVLAECIVRRHPFVRPGGTPRDAILRVAAREQLPIETVDELGVAGFGCLVKALKPWPVERYRWPANFVKALTQEV